MGNTGMAIQLKVKEGQEPPPSHKIFRKDQGGGDIETHMKYGYPHLIL